LIEVTYEVLPWSVEIDDAIQARRADPARLHEVEGKPSNIGGRIEVKKGDIAQGFRAAEIVIERSFATRPVHQGYIEPHACLISVGADNKTTIWSSSQGQFMVRAMTAYLTGIPQSDIRRHSGGNRGGFGGKTIVYLEPLATCSRKNRTPVKMVMTREEVMRADRADFGLEEHGQDRPTRDGKIVAAQARSICRPARCRLADRAPSAAAFALRYPHRAFGGFDVSPTALEGRGLSRAGAPTAPMRWSAARRLAEG